jgi:Tetracyclin repressor-like, C-terminal domain
MHSPFVEMIATVLGHGYESGDFRMRVDPVQLYISIAALAYFYLSNSATLSVIFGRDLLAEDAKRQRLQHMIDLVLAALAGDDAAAVPAELAGTAAGEILNVSDRKLG